MVPDTSYNCFEGKPVYQEIEFDNQKDKSAKRCVFLSVFPFIKVKLLNCFPGTGSGIKDPVRSPKRNAF